MTYNYNDIIDGDVYHHVAIIHPPIQTRLGAAGEELVIPTDPYTRRVTINYELQASLNIQDIRNNIARRRKEEANA
jgi:hypothetical protein